MGTNSGLASFCFVVVVALVAINLTQLESSERREPQLGKTVGKPEGHFLD